MKPEIVVGLSIGMPLVALLVSGFRRRTIMLAPDYTPCSIADAVNSGELTELNAKIAEFHKRWKEIPGKGAELVGYDISGVLKDYSGSVKFAASKSHVVPTLSVVPRYRRMREQRLAKAKEFGDGLTRYYEDGLDFLVRGQYIQETDRFSVHSFARTDASGLHELFTDEGDAYVREHRAELIEKAKRERGL